MSKPTRDLFICYANEDTDDVARPPMGAFTAAGRSCWYDGRKKGVGLRCLLTSRAIFTKR